MALNAKKSSGTCKVSMDGDMTIFTASALKADLLNNLDACSEFEIDLSKVSEIDTAGFQLLVMIKREAAVLNKTFRIVSHSAATAAVVDLYNMADYFRN